MLSVHLLDVHFYLGEPDLVSGPFPAYRSHRLELAESRAIQRGEQFPLFDGGTHRIAPDRVCLSLTPPAIQFRLSIPKLAIRKPLRIPGLLTPPVRAELASETVTALAACVGAIRPWASGSVPAQLDTAAQTRPRPAHVTKA